MRSFSFGAAALVLLMTTSASASVMTIGGSLAKACYESAKTRSATLRDLEYCDRALSEEALIFDDTVATHVNRGVLFLARGEMRTAEADFDRAIKLNPNQAEAWLNKGVVRYKAGDLEAAKRMMDRAIELGTLRPELAYYARGVINEDRGNLRAAYADLQKAASLAPEWDAPLAELQRYRVRSN